MNEKNNISCSSCNTRYLSGREEKINKKRKSNLYNQCQSCGDELLKDDNNEHTFYCSRCWKDGRFSNANISLKKMKEENEIFFLNKDYKKKKIKSINKNLRKLIRWKKR